MEELAAPVRRTMSWPKTCYAWVSAVKFVQVPFERKALAEEQRPRIFRQLERLPNIA